jgi:predicted transposase YdaD
LDMIKDIVEGDEMDMCEGMERMAEGFRSEGREEGILVGRNEGKLEEKQNTLLMQLRCKLGDLSKETENTIRSSTMEKLNKLTVSIFDIQSENDVLKLIH